MGSMEFAAQYQQSPVPVGGNLIRWSWFRFYDQQPRVGSRDRIIISWDTALSSAQLADYSACVVLLLQEEKIFVLDVLRARLEYPDLRRTVISTYDRWHASPAHCSLLIEEKGSGQSLIQDLRRQRIHAIGVMPEGDKIMRMAAQAACIEAGAVHLPHRAPWLDEFRIELLAFPVGKFDDQIDALSQALLRANAPRAPVARTGSFQWL